MAQISVPAVRRLRRSERRGQIIAAATRAFGRTGFAATSLDDVALEAGISRVILYRHFESKTDLYRAVLDRACERLVQALGPGRFTGDTIDALLGAAADDPDGFRLLFHHAAREPEFRVYVDDMREGGEGIAREYLAAQIPDPAWATWAVRLSPTVSIDAVIAWLDAGQPDRAQAADRIRHVLDAIVTAARQHAAG